MLTTLHCSSGQDGLGRWRSTTTYLCNHFQLAHFSNQGKLGFSKIGEVFNFYVMAILNQQFFILKKIFNADLEQISSQIPIAPHHSKVGAIESDPIIAII